ncbi:hypothetical protein QTP88_019457 [Uroleucon formosanum]
MNVYKASVTFNVPRSSLQNIVSGKVDLSVRKFEPEAILGKYEVFMVKWIGVMSQKGFPIVSSDLLSSVEKIVKDLNLDTKFPNGKPGKKWLKLFMNRHPIVAKRTVEKVFNTDESGFMMCPKKEKVLSIRGTKNVYEVVGNNEKHQITVLVNVSAAGVVAPTMVVFAEKRLPKGIVIVVQNNSIMTAYQKTIARNMDLIVRKIAMMS